jgi:hypothetical protein
MQRVYPGTKSSPTRADFAVRVSSGEEVGCTELRGEPETATLDRAVA